MTPWMEQSHPPEAYHQQPGQALQQHLPHYHPRHFSPLRPGGCVPVEQHYTRESYQHYYPPGNTDRYTDNIDPTRSELRYKQGCNTEFYPEPRQDQPPPPRPGGRRQLPPTPSHPSTLSLETILPTICITQSPSTPARNLALPTNFPRVEVSPSHSSCWSPSTFSLSSLLTAGPQTGPRLGVSPSRAAAPR